MILKMLGKQRAVADWRHTGDCGLPLKSAPIFIITADNVHYGLDFVQNNRHVLRQQQGSQSA